MTRRRQFGSIGKVKDRPGLYIRFTHEGRRILRYAGKNKTVAGKRLAKIQALLEDSVDIEDVLAQVFGEVRGSGLTFREVAERYRQRARKPNTSADSIAKENRRLDGVCKARWSGKRMSAIKPPEVARWLEARAKETSSATANRDRSVASALFSWARQQGYCRANPIMDVRKFSEKGRARETYLTLEESRALVRACDPTIRPIVLAAIATGMRRGELLGLEWRSVDLQAATVTVEPEKAKSGKGRAIPMTGDLVAALRRLLLAAGTAGSRRTSLIFPINKWTLRDRFKKAVSSCEDIPHDKKITFHTLRHTAASLLIQSGTSLEKIQRILGHSTFGMTLRYAHLVPEFARDEIRKHGERLGFEDVG